MKEREEHSENPDPLSAIMYCNHVFLVWADRHTRKPIRTEHNSSSEVTWNSSSDARMDDEQITPFIHTSFVI